MASCCSSPGQSAIHERSQLASKLLLQAQKLRIERNVGGVQKMERKIKAEKTFLESILSGNTPLKCTHLSSSNLTHLQSVLLIAQETEGLVAVQQCFTLGITPVSIQVDVVGEEGGRWIRVFCRKRSALHQRWLGDGQFGDKAVSDIAAEYIETSKQNLHKFQPPKIFFIFFDGITESISRVLHGSEIQVVGPVYADDSTEEAPSLSDMISLFRESLRTSPSSRDSEHVELPSREQQQASGTECQGLNIPSLCCHYSERVNLDVSSMLAWVSSLTHGGHTYVFEERILNEQAEQERKFPLWPQLQSATKGKQFIACRSAIDGFCSIVETIGGEQEKTRARSLLDMVDVVDDCPSARAMSLTVSHRIKQRAKVVFGSGDTLCTTTLTANGGFLRAAAHQGVHFEAYVHPSRALTEAKQL